MGTLQVLLNRLDPDPIVRGRQFEHICKWFLETDPVYAPQLRRVWLWKDWPGRWGADAGIDLVAETTEGKLWAIQAKAYAPAYRVKKSDVDTFLSESSREVFSYRLLIATTNHVGATALRTLPAQEKPAHLSLLGDLERAAVEWPPSPKRLIGRPAKPKKPRPHQQRAIRDLVRGFEDEDRGQLIMACGTGKTLLALWLSEAMEAQRTLLLLPSLSLLAQTLREWRANATRPFEALPVCSDETVRGEDLLAAHASDLPFPVTTDTDEITAFLRKRGPRVVFSTYQSSPRIAEAFAGGRVPDFDLAIADEAHRVAGSAARDFGTILDAHAIPAARRLFMTATPRYVKSRVKRQAEEADLDVASMDDSEKFGPVLHRLTFSEAIERGWLSDYQVAVVAVDDETIQEYAERGTFVEFGDGVIDARTLAAHIGLAKAMRKWNLRRVVSFHSRVEWARRFADSMPKVVKWMPTRKRPKGSLWGDHVSGAMPSGERDVLLDRLRDVGAGERGLLSNARCLAEGVDVPALDGVAFIDPRRSEVDIVQAVGRAIRKSKDKTVGTIVLPVFVGSGEDAEARIETSAFDHVWQVLLALRAHDEVLAEELDALRRELGRRGSLGRRPGKIILLLPVGIDPGFARVFDARLVDTMTASWEFWFGLPESYVRRHGTAAVPPGYRTESGYQLGSWAGTQRGLARRGVLRPDRYSLLEGLPGWVWHRHDARWERAFDLLLAFSQREHHALVPDGHVERGFPLGSWVRIQRQGYAAGRLQRSRIDRLSSVPTWTWVPLLDAHWERGFDALYRFAQREGHSRVPRGQVEDGFALGTWVKRQRAAFQEGRLAPERAARLAAVPGWSWDPRNEAWEKAFTLLVQFVEREGHAFVPPEHQEEGFLLGPWVINQRMRRRGLVSEQATRLEGLPGWVWDPDEARWEVGFAHLQEFTTRNGHALVPGPFLTADGYRLGQWVEVQRLSRRQGVLGPKRVQRLESTPGWVWDPFEAQWERGFSCLLSYVEEHGTAAFPRSFVSDDGYPLGRWTSHQRVLYRQGRLRVDRATRLGDLDGWDWNPGATRWSAPR